jgi:hypothetical protein
MILLVKTPKNGFLKPFFGVHKLTTEHPHFPVSAGELAWCDVV